MNGQISPEVFKDIELLKAKNRVLELGIEEFGIFHDPRCEIKRRKSE